MLEVDMVIPVGDRAEAAAGGGTDAMESEHGREPPVGVACGVLQLGVPGGVPP